jgi:hypothetical protein
MKETKMNFPDLHMVEEPDTIFLPEGANSLEFLQILYRDPRQPMLRRLKAAIAALPFESPKLGVSVVIDASEDFAKRLDAAIARSMRVIEARPEPKPPEPMDHRPTVDHRPPVATTDRRFRR